MKRSYSILCKPAGARCNLSCEYCYYIDKQHTLDQSNTALMSTDVLEMFIKQYSKINTFEYIEFVWQGGEPTLCGIDFFEDAVKIQKKFCAGKQVQNILQTNAVNLDDKFCKFLKANDFLVGVSIDGPKRLHDLLRVDLSGKGTFDRVMKSINLLKYYDIRFNTLTVLNSVNSRHPLEVYSFLKEIGDGYMQFLPIVERIPSQYETELGMKFSKPPELQNIYDRKKIYDFSLTPELFADFYIAIFNQWYKNDIGKYFVQLFEATYGNMNKMPPGFCVHEKVCGHAAAIEHNGDIYSCDHFVYDDYFLGNIMSENLYDIMEKNRPFGMSKYLALPEKCVNCDVFDLCSGGCPKHRISGSYKSLNYLCEGYYLFFKHAKAILNTIK